VVGLDSLVSYYDVNLKLARLRVLQEIGRSDFSFWRNDLANDTFVDALFVGFRPRVVFHLGAQAGVQYSIENPRAYVDANVVGTFNVLQAARKVGTERLFFASSSTVYGSALSEERTENMELEPISFYGLTKLYGEQMCDHYSRDLSIVMGRLFTVYGPWGRPDMSIQIFIDAMENGRKIKLVGDGRVRRSYTFVDDVVKAVIGLTESAHVGVFNIGNSRAVELLEVVKILEELTGRRAVLEFAERKEWDILASRANATKLQAALGWNAEVPIEQGVKQTLIWYRGYRKA